MLLLVVEHVEIVAPALDIIQHVSFKYFAFEAYFAALEQLLSVARVQRLPAGAAALPRLRSQSRHARVAVLLLIRLRAKVYLAALLVPHLASKV